MLLNKYIKSLLFCLLYTINSYDSIYGQSARLKDLTNIKGVRSNSLIGFGIVTGLSKTGDTEASVSTKRAAAQMLQSLGVKVSEEELSLGSFASVIVTADLPAFSRIGDRIDVRISISGDATSLAGGTLLNTRLSAGDGNIYAVAQGAVVVGQASGEGPEILTVARVPKGGVIEREFAPTLAADGKIILNLKNADFTTNARITHKINSYFKGFYAKSLDSSSVRINIPEPYQVDVVAFIAKLEALRVKTDRKAVVVLNERTGTVVMGDEVSIGAITIAHGNLSVHVKSTDNQEDEANEEALLPVKGTTVGELVKSLNRLGVKPMDLIGILQAVAAAGALHGELVFL